MRRSRRAGERAALVAEHLALDEVARDRRAVHPHEGAVAPAAARVDRRGHELFAGARLARDHHARIARRDALDEPAHLAHSRAVADHLAAQSEVGAQRSRLSPRLAQLHRRRQREQHALGAQRLLQEVERAELGRFHRVAQPRAAAHHDDRHVGERLAHARERRHPVQLAGDHQVEQERVGLRLERARQAAGAVVRVADLVALGHEQRADHPADVRLVVDDQHARHSTSLRGRVGVRQSVLLHLGHQLGGEPLRFGDPLDLDGDRLDALLDPLEAAQHLGRHLRRRRRAALEAPRDGADRSECPAR